VKADYWAILDDIEAEPGDAAVGVARQRAKSFASRWRKLCPAAVDCLEDDFEHLVTYLRFPAEHWGRIRHSNFISSARSARPVGGPR
jgi:putative transposase